jgi:hypothetical protein
MTNLDARPGELNLMIAGRGITHQELSAAGTRALHGVQLWYALPDETRFGENAFAHHAPEPVTLPGGTARVFLGELLGSVSPVATRTPDLLGAELVLDPGATARLPVRADFEHAVLAVGRDHDEIVEFRRRYQAELGFEPADPRDEGKPALFGTFPPDQLPPLPAPPLPNARLLPREQ